MPSGIFSSSGDRLLKRAQSEWRAAVGGVKERETVPQQPLPSRPCWGRSVSPFLWIRLGKLQGIIIMTLLTSFIQLALSKKTLPRSTKTGDDRFRWKCATDSPFGIGSDFLRLFFFFSPSSLSASESNVFLWCSLNFSRCFDFFPSVNFSLITHEFAPICTACTGKISILLRRK